MHPGESLRQAFALHQRGDLTQAEKLYQEILRLHPQSFDACHLLGVLRAQQGRASEARTLIEQALALKPGDVAALASHGKLLMQLGDFAAAQKSYDQALAARPGSPDLLYARGNAEREAGQLAAAEQSYLAAIKAQPNFADAFSNRGAVLQLMGRADDALANLDRAIALVPGHARALNNRATLLADQHRFSEAIDSASRAIAAQPRFAEAFANRGSAHWQLHQTAEALADFNQALAINPDLTSALSNRARLLWSQMRDFEPARRDLEHLLKRDPNFPLAQGDLFYVRASIGDWRSFDADVTALTRAVDAGELAVQPFIYQACATSSASLLACAKTTAAREYPPRTSPKLQPGLQHAGGKIRIGYVCGEFRGHATAYLSAGLFEQHDCTAFDIIAFDNGARDDSPTRARLEKAFDQLISIKALGDEQAAKRIAEEQIDILVNLNGYYGDHRMGVFAHRPAAVQVNWLGFPGTLGASYIDYIIADRIVLPGGEQNLFTEQVVWLPNSYQVNDNRRATAPHAPSRAEAGLPGDGFVFCNFNQPYKLSPAMLQRWLGILTRVPNSVLWLWANTKAFEANIKRFAAAHGVDPARLVIAGPAAQPDHLARLALADLFLDSLPYNAHTTASDALWAGVPLITCTGTTFAGRVATSLLHAANLPELITTTPQDYEELAVALATEPQRLRVLRARLSHQRDSCALFDTEGFTRHLESAFTTMAQRARAGLAPQSFAVAP